MTQIPFSPDLLEKGYKLIYRNGERPEDYKIWPDGRISTFYGDIIMRHDTNGWVGLIEEDYDLFLTPPEMYVGVYEGGYKTFIYHSLEEIKDKHIPGYKLYRLVPVEES